MKLLWIILYLFGGYDYFDDIEKKMHKILRDIKNGSFNKELSKSKKIEYKDPFSKKDKDYFDKLMELLFSEK